MAAIRHRDTSAERRIRSALHRAGLRYRLGQQILTEGGRLAPDIVFRAARVAVFVDGCFWHGCPQHCRMPSSNIGYWAPKIDRNRARDRRNDEELHAAGWTVVRVWEHDDPQAAAQRVIAALRGAERATPGSSPGATRARRRPGRETPAGSPPGGAGQ